MDSPGASGWEQTLCGCFTHSPGWEQRKGTTGPAGLSPCLGRGWLHRGGEAIRSYFRSRTSPGLWPYRWRDLGASGAPRWWKGCSGGYLPEADGQQLSRKVGPFTHGEDSTYKPVVETGKVGLVPSDLPFALPEPAFSQHPGLLAISSQQTDQEFPGLMLPPSQHLPGAASRPGLCWVGPQWRGASRGPDMGDGV